MVSNKAHDCEHKRKGRIRTHQRDTNNARILGSKLKISESHEDAVRETEKQEIDDSLRKNYQNRLGHIMDFWRENYQNYYSVGVRKLRKAELEDKNQFWHNNTEDLIYTGINVEFVKAYFALIQIKKNGKMMGIENIQKYKDAIIWGSKEANEPLPPSFYN